MSHFGTPYWTEDYFNQFFRANGGGAIVGALSGSFAGTSSFSGTLEAAAYGHSGVVRLAGSLVREDGGAGVSIEGLLAVMEIARRSGLPEDQATVETQQQTAAHEAITAELARIETLAAAGAKKTQWPANDDDEAIALLLVA